MSSSKLSDGSLLSATCQSNVFTQTVDAALHASSLFTRDASCDTEVVLSWLEALGLSQYVPAFRAQNITARTLFSLHADELRITLGVANLKDRRLMLSGINYLQKVLAKEEGPALPEDARILTHLMAERVLLGWASLSLTLQMLAMALTRLVQTKKNADIAFIMGLACVLEVMAFSMLCCAIYRHFWMERMVEKPDHDEHIPKFFPLMLVFAGTVIVLYAIFSNYIEGSAIVSMLSV